MTVSVCKGRSASGRVCGEVKPNSRLERTASALAGQSLQASEKGVNTAARLLLLYRREKERFVCKVGEARAIFTMVDQPVKWGSTV